MNRGVITCSSLPALAVASLAPAGTFGWQLVPPYCEGVCVHV